MRAVSRGGLRLPKTRTGNFSIEFPAGPLALGGDVPVKAEGEMAVDGVIIKMLSPTQAVMGRLAWFYHYNDRQCLDQAVLVAKHQPINRRKLKEWSTREGAAAKLSVFLNRLDSKK